jgi:hypothetical protein
MSTNNFLDPSLHDQDAPDAKRQQQPPPPLQQQQPGAMDVYYHAPMPHHQPQPQPQSQPQGQQQPQQLSVMNVPAAVQEGAVPPQSDVDEFLRKKRKAREHKACYPCRQRKVKYVISVLSRALNYIVFSAVTIKVPMKNQNLFSQQKF